MRWKSYTRKQNLQQKLQPMVETICDRYGLAANPYADQALQPHFEQSRRPGNFLYSCNLLRLIMVVYIHGKVNRNESRHATADPLFPAPFD